MDRLPQEFIVDDQDGINDPVGMIGARLAVKVHIVTSPVTARQNAINAVNRAGLVVADMVLEQLAAAEASLTDDDKEFGAALVDFDHDGTPDLAWVNGLVKRGKGIGQIAPGVPPFWANYAQRSQLFANDGQGNFRDISTANPSFTGQAIVGRGHYHETYRRDGGEWRIATLSLTRLSLDITWPKGHESA